MHSVRGSPDDVIPVFISPLAQPSGFLELVLGGGAAAAGLVVFDYI
jgi:hypothetical protein